MSELLRRTVQVLEVLRASDEGLSVLTSPRDIAVIRSAIAAVAGCLELVIASS